MFSSESDESSASLASHLVTLVCDHFPRPGALLFDKKGHLGEPLFGILICNDGHVMRVFWGDGRKSDVFKWQLDERLIEIVIP